jgi:ribose transport system permease protein
LVCGLGNGLLVTHLRLPPFIATLGSMMMLRGIVLTITNANSSPAPESFGDLGNNTLLRVANPEGGVAFPGISYIVLIMIGCAFVFHFILKMTRLGRYTYSIGSNEEASRLSGIRIKPVKLAAYMISGFLAALVGVLLASRMVTSQPNGGVGYELSAIAAAVIGGTSLMGGIGTVTGTVLGSFIIGILNTGLTMAGASYFAQQIVIGAVVILAVALDQLRHRR